MIARPPGSDKGINIDAKKFLAWSNKMRLADVGGFMKILQDAVETNDVEFLEQFPWFGGFCQRETRPTRMRSKGGKTPK